MTTISKKQNFLAASVIATMAGVALSIPSAASAATLTTYDFEFQFADNTNGIGYIVVDKGNQSSRPNGTLIREGDSFYRQDKWIDFSFASFGMTYTKADLAFGFLSTYDPANNSPDYSTYGGFQGGVGLSIPNRGFLQAQDSTSNFGNRIITSFVPVTSFSLTERKAVPVPAFALGIVAAGGWIGAKQLRRKTKGVKQEVSV